MLLHKQSRHWIVIYKYSNSNQQCQRTSDQRQFEMQPIRNPDYVIVEQVDKLEDNRGW